MKVNIIIVNYNSLNEVLATLNYLNERRSERIRVIVVNNSNDIFNEHNDYYFELHVIGDGFNLGYTGGNNKGYKFLESNGYLGNVVVMNSDVRVNVSDILKLNDKMSNSAIGAIMTGAHNEENETLYNAITFKDYRQVWNVEKTKNGLVETDYIAGSFFIIKRKVISEVGFFDDAFFLYWEEVDLSMRILDKGYKLMSDTSISVLRNGNTLEGIVNSIYYLVRNSFLLKKKHEKRLSAKGLFFYNIKMLLKSLYLSLRIKSFIPIKLNLKGLMDGIFR